MRVVLVLVASLLGLAASVSYEGYKVYKIDPKSDSEIEMLLFLEQDSNFDFWSRINKVGNPISVMVTPEKQKDFVEYLETNKVSYTVEIDNVERTIQAEKREHLSKPKVEKGRISFTQYYRHDEINAYLVQLAKDYPDIVTVETIGQSYEGRDLVLVHIAAGPSSPDRPVIFVDAGIHAREWIAPATALYLINQLVEVPENRRYIEGVTWVVWPNVNPDGYEYSWDTSRLWRKTRTPGTSCYGVDANRNFDFHWMETGASARECDETYAGRVAFSEVETATLRDTVLATKNVKLYLTLHSYGQYLLYPWGYNSDLPDNWEELDDLGQAVNSAISAIRGTRYTVGSSTRVLYAAAGASDDWAMGIAGIGLVYTIELPGGGWYGFDMPASGINAVVVETWQGFKVYHDYVLSKAK